MINTLTLLITLISNPSFCQSPCTINTLIHLETPDVQGEMCLHLLPMELKDSEEHIRSCRYIDRTSYRYTRISFPPVGKGDYVIYATVDDKIVSNKQTIHVLGGLTEEKLK